MVRASSGLDSAQLVLYFGGRGALESALPHKELRQYYPNARFLGCSTAGEICDTTVSEETVVATAIHFEDTRLRFAYQSLADVSGSFQAGERLASDLDHEGLVVRRGVLQSDTGFLQKPFEVSALAHAVRRAIERTG